MGSPRRRRTSLSSTKTSRSGQPGAPHCGRSGAIQLRGVWMLSSTQARDNPGAAERQRKDGMATASAVRRLSGFRVNGRLGALAERIALALLIGTQLVLRALYVVNHGSDS